MNVPTFDHLADSRTDGLLDASYVGKRATLYPTAQLAPSSSTYCSSKLTIPLAILQEGKFWSYLPQMMAARAPPRRI